MDLEGGARTPTRCDSSLSVVKIVPATRSKKSSIPFVAQKFSDPEMESLYHLHSTHRKKTELFQTFLYAVLLYCIVQIAIKSYWIAQKNMASPAAPPPGEPQYLKSGSAPGNFDGDSLRRVIRDLHPIESVRKENLVVKLHPVRNLALAVAKKSVQVTVTAKEPQAKKNCTGTGNGEDCETRRVLLQSPRVKRDQRDLYGLSDRFGGEGGDSSSSSMSAKGEIVYTATSFALLAITTIISMYMLLKIGPFKDNPHIPAILWLVTILLPIVVRNDSTLPLRIGFEWILLENFLIWVTLPIRLKTAVGYSVVLAVSHTCIVVWKGNNQEYLAYQIGANLLLLMTTDLLGVLAFYLDDKKQRRAFLDTRQSLEMKLVIEEQAKEQEQLLLSVLPEHLAIKMRQDMGAAVDGQFKTVYMSRHENVSILYADIVGFTAISSTYSASELVKILNELFARFDKLAEKYHQLRIKILGDCYYCICGAPEEREDHAVLSVHMGLSMVTAIKYVRESTKSPVDMRVGVHTGAILAGVLGQRQWQFDVYSKDVELANKMESSGMPGRVHISEKTLSYLNGEFEVELAHGEKREEILRLAGLKTYFIVKILKPFSDSHPNKNANNAENNVDEIEKDMPTFAEESSAVEENHTTRKDSNMEAYRKRLKEELISRDGYRDLSAQSKHFGLRFRDDAMESQFNENKEPYAGVSSISSPVALTAFSLASFMVISFNVLSFITAVLGILILLMISAMSASETSIIKSGAKKSSGVLGFMLSLDDKLWIRRLFAIVTILLLTLANGIFTLPCLEEGRKCSNYTYDFDADDDRVEVPLALPTTPKVHNAGCHFPAYLVIFCSFFLFAVTLLPQPGFWVKFLLLTGVIAAHGSLINLPLLRVTMECSESFSFRGQDIIREHWQLSVFIAAILIILIILNRRLEKSSRVLFLWKNEVELQRERAAVLRQKNEALVYNILPPHVATHFLGTRKRKHDELYSQSYSEVGILFASMPNFSDFYTEESVNNQGLECLRFLNEVISDFDSLLDVPRFAESIIKIKTISSTYMAASGLNPSKQANADDPLKIRWAHLSLLVEFAFELKRTLTGINEQSFNHFVLKMGINHGPAVAGVIGVKKPHYDIWGDTVNVASRMESTGKAGYIQVTEKTQKILCIYGYKFEQRGLVNVKGKGQLMTYYLVGRGAELSDYEIEKLMQADASQNAEQ